jgi:ribosomal protein L24E
MMDADEERVQSFLESNGLRAERFCKAEIRAGKTPDYRVHRNGEFLFFCEVKSSREDRWLDDHRPDRLLFSQTDEDHQTKLLATLGLSQNEITQIDS